MAERILQQNFEDPNYIFDICFMYQTSTNVLFLSTWNGHLRESKNYVTKLHHVKGEYAAEKDGNLVFK